MGFRYRSENENLKAHIATLRGLSAALLLIILALWHGWEEAKKDVRLHLPPDLRSGAVLRIETPEPQNVYAFAHHIFQQINYWPDSGEKDYGVAIYRMAGYLTPRFIDELKSDLEQRAKRGELSERIRAVQDMPGHGYEESRVPVHGNGAWTVLLDLHIDEHVRGMEVKSVSIRYPLRVIHYDVNPETNPWGLALDGYDAPGPQRIEPEKSGEPFREKKQG